jgi:Bacterial protein of unknown function (DUF899)
LADGLDGSLVHLNRRDVTLLCFSRAPIGRLSAYKRRMGWQFPYVSTYNTDFAFDFGLALTEEQAEQTSELNELIDNPPGWLQEWSGQIGAELKDGLRENPVTAYRSRVPARGSPGPRQSQSPVSEQCERTASISTTARTSTANGRTGSQESGIAAIDEPCCLMHDLEWLAY